MKKLILFILTLLAIILTYSTAFAGTKDEYINYLKKSINEPIQETFYDDFDKNGSYEMFAFVGEKYEADEFDPEIIMGSLYYVDDNTCKECFSSNFVVNSIAVVDIGERKHLYVCEHYAVEDITYVFDISSDYPILKGGYIQYNNNKSIICKTAPIDIGYDSSFGSFSGRSVKDYWYYCDSEYPYYHEYGGINITKEQFLSFDGAQEILSSINGEIIDILYRANGIININVKHSNGKDYTMGNYMLGYNDGKVRIIQDEYGNDEGEGFYLAAFNPEKAVYPEFNVTSKPVSISVILNDENLIFDVEPYIENGTTMVPMRKIFEKLGSEVNYEAQTKTITAQKGSTIIELVTNSNIAKINGRQVTLAVPIENKNGTTMVPLRFIAEALGAEVNWDGDTKVITITLLETNNNEDNLSNNTLLGHSNVILTIYDNRNNIWDGIVWSVANLSDGVKHIIDIEEEVPDVEQGKVVLANILANVPEIESEPIDTSKYTDITDLASGGVAIIEDYFGPSTKETRLLKNSIDTLGDVIDWSAFSIEEIDFLLRDYKKNIRYFDLLQSNCNDEYINAIIDELMQDYTDKWYKTIMDMNEKMVDEVVDKGVDVVAGFYTAGVYPVVKYSSDLISNVTGLKSYSDALANFYQVCRMINPVDETLEKSITKYKNGECTETELKAALELNKATKIYAYECIAEFGKASDADKAYANIQDVNRFEFKDGEIVYNRNSSGSSMGGR